MASKNIWVWAFLFVFSTTGCGTLKFQSDINDENTNVSEIDSEADGSNDDSSLPEVADLPNDEDSSAEITYKVSEPYESSLGDIALDKNVYIEKWIQYFKGKGREHMARYLERSSRYLPMMRYTLRENGLPEDLVYVALIESGFSPRAHSHADAVGYWQFIRSTGRRYGLRQDGYIDERRDPVLSTRAAAEYFKALYNLFGSWHLALAAYNTGENRVKNRVMRYYTRDYWELVRRRALPRETRNYVPKFIAAALIAKDPQAYGFNDINPEPALTFETASVPHPVSLAKLAKQLEMDEDEIKLLNPRYRTDYVPLYETKETILRLPPGKSKKISSQWAVAKVDNAPAPIADNVIHRVRRGETLSHIAVKYRTSVATIRRINNMGRRSFLRVGQRLRVPDRGGRMQELARSTSSSVASSSSSDSQDTPEKLEFHVVRRGENLSLISRRYGVSVGDLMKLNSLSRRSVLRVGQRLKLKQTYETSNSSSSHKVKRGENLTLIAKRFNVSVHDLRKWNGLSSDTLYVGQNLKLRAGSTSVSTKVVNRPFYHEVGRGENLTLIARKYKTSVSSLLSLNQLKNRSRLYVGQKIKISKRTLVHVVRRGETLGSIAQRYKISVRQLVTANDIANKRRILAGQSLIIPD
ncbi:MAG: LysM peptidoglycan-binding domain-containing protein [Bdellovibrionales bacterium]|nr:LysM peptidoglycan-binding domain-containing protein [Bdellovibrionales bacterium]